jgi:ABC-type dipeptide/oligopeptide/nickel transport system permease subunit
MSETDDLGGPAVAESAVETGSTVASEGLDEVSIGQWRLALRKFKRRKVSVFSLVTLTIIMLGAALADLGWISDFLGKVGVDADWSGIGLAPYGETEQNLSDILESPNRTYLLGTDTLGRDNLSRILYGGRVSLGVGLAVAVIAGFVGTLVGLLAGYYGHWVDAVLMRVTDTMLALPALMIAIIAARILGDGVWDIIFVLAGISWMILARIVRGKVLALKEREFIEAARALGVPNRRIMSKHILPNLVGEITVAVSLTVAAAILGESTLSFLGLGVSAVNTATWGNMLGGNEGFVITAPWLVWAPGMAIVITALCVNFIGDGLRDALDPTQKKT